MVLRNDDQGLVERFRFKGIRKLREVLPPDEFGIQFDLRSVGPNETLEIDERRQCCRIRAFDGAEPFDADLRA